MESPGIKTKEFDNTFKVSRSIIQPIRPNLQSSAPGDLPEPNNSLLNNGNWDDSLFWNDNLNWIEI